MKKLKFPTAHTVLLIIAALVTLFTFIIPSGKYERLSYNSDKKEFIHTKKDTTITYPAHQKILDSLGIKTSIDKFTNKKIKKPLGIPNTYYSIPKKEGTTLQKTKEGIIAFIQSPLKGIEKAIDVILFVLIIGGFIGVVHKTGAFDAGIQQLAKTLKGKETILIIAITSLIALGGTTFGLAEETIAFYPILVPVFLAAGYDAMVALAAIYIGSSIGTMCSTINPFSSIIASNSAGIDWTTGLNSRLFLLIIGTAFCLWYIIRYAEKVRKDPSKSIIYAQKEAIEKMFLISSNQAYEFTNRIKIILIIFVTCFAVMIKGVYSWDWWFLEMTTVFFVGAILIGIIARLKEVTLVESFVKGANDLLSVALIIGLARGVTVLMDEGLISDTLLYYSSNTVEGMPKGIFVNVMMFLYGGLSFFVPSSSGLAVLSMPIMAPLADVVDIGREHVVNAYQCGMGLMAFITPTGLILASLTMVNVTYDKWLRFVMPLLIGLTILTMIMLTTLVYL